MRQNYYVDGNAVRRLEEEPQERIRRRQEEEQKKQRHRYAARRNQERALYLNLGYVIFCSLAVLLTCGVCVAYIYLQSDVTGRTKSISRLESRISELRASNDEILKRIEMSVDLNEIGRQAMLFGMKYPEEGQIFSYTVKDDDFMDQFSDVPKK